MSEETDLVGQEPAPDDVQRIPQEEPAPSDQDAPELEASDDADGSETEVDSEDTDEPKKPRQKASERIGELYGRMKSAERERDQLRQELERLQQPIVNAEQWDNLSYEQQQYALTKSAVREERAAEVQRELEIREQNAAYERQALFEERLSEARQRLPNIDDALSDPTLPISQVQAQMIQESEKGPEIIYWLSQNKADARRIAALPAARQIYELGKIEARVSTPVKARKVSMAPKPVSTINGGGTPGAKSYASMGIDDFSAMFKAKGIIGS